MRNLLYTIEGADVVECVDTWRKPTMKTEDLIVDKCGKGKVVEQICEVLPDVCVAILA